MNLNLPKIDRRDDIPVPPFADGAAFEVFHRALARHIAELGRASGGPHPETLALCSVIDSEARSALQRPGNEVGAYPSPLALSIALRTFFPAAWTPQRLVEVVRDVLRPRWMNWDSITASRISYRSDPDFSAHRDKRSVWTITFIERGVSHVDARLEGDWQLVLYLMDHVSDRFPFPYGHSTPQEAASDEAARRGARAVVEAFDHQRELPYLHIWTELENPENGVTSA